MNTVAATPAMDPRRQAKFLYWTGWRVTDIA
ncbi:MAG: terminase gpP N-terminus-related DNA-binding protein, partial [Solimonas sp.]